jgi:hypothetical protein
VPDENDMHLVAEPSSSPWNIILKTDDGRSVGVIAVTHVRLAWPEHCPIDRLRHYEHQQVRDWLVERINGAAQDRGGRA